MGEGSQLSAEVTRAPARCRAATRSWPRTVTDLAARRGRRAASGGWWLVGALACALLPWYLSADKTLLQSLPGVFGGADTASALVQALVHGKAWLWACSPASPVCAVGVALPGGRRQGAWLVGGSALGLAGLLVTGFAVGARGWSFESLDAAFRRRCRRTGGLGLGGVLALASLLMLLGLGLARRGFFRGDLFVSPAPSSAAARCCCSSSRCRCCARWRAPSSTRRARYRSPRSLEHRQRACLGASPA